MRQNDRAPRNEREKPSQIEIETVKNGRKGELNVKKRDEKKGRRRDEE
jgi:hypothetical protein